MQRLDSERQAAHDQDQTSATDCHRLVDGAPILVVGGLPLAPALSGEESPPAQPGDGQPVVPEETGRSGDATFLQLVSPGRDAPDAGSDAAVDKLPEGPLLRNRGRGRRYFFAASRTIWTMSGPISGSYLAMMSLTASWKGFLSVMTLTLTPFALIFSRFSVSAFSM